MSKAVVGEDSVGHVDGQSYYPGGDVQWSVENKGLAIRRGTWAADYVWMHQEISFQVTYGHRNQALCIQWLILYCSSSANNIGNQNYTKLKHTRKNLKGESTCPKIYQSFLCFLKFIYFPFLYICDIYIYIMIFQSQIC